MFSHCRERRYSSNNLKVQYLFVWDCKSSQSETKQRIQSDVQLIDRNRNIPKKIFVRLVFCQPAINQKIASWGGHQFVSIMTLSDDWTEKVLISVLTNFVITLTVPSGIETQHLLVIVKSSIYLWFCTFLICFLLSFSLMISNF